eukprot:2133003-Rhodomonas_salina.1
MAVALSSDEYDEHVRANPQSKRCVADRDRERERERASGCSVCAHPQIESFGAVSYTHLTLPTICSV